MQHGHWTQNKAQKLKKDDGKYDIQHEIQIHNTKKHFKGQ